MKLIIVGATGFVGTEVLRQSLLRKDITSIVAVTRRALASPAESQKLKNVVVKDYDQYDDEAKKAFKDANGCIWTIAITPSKSSNFAWEEVVRVCQTSTMTSLRTLHEAGVGNPFRFVYMSGAAAERDATKTPKWKPEYSLMRGETENQVLAFASQHNFEATVAKPGIITDGSIKRAMASALFQAVNVPSISVAQCAAAMLEQVVNGIEKEPLMNEDLIEVAQRIEKEGRKL